MTDTASTALTYGQVIAAWNAQADDHIEDHKLWCGERPVDA